MKTFILINIILSLILLILIFNLIFYENNNIYINILQIILVFSNLLIFNFLLTKENDIKIGYGQNINLFNSREEFKTFVYNNFCQCSSQCIDMPNNNKQNINPCSQIILNPIFTKHTDFDNIINKTIISFLSKIDILQKSGNKLYIKIDNNNTLKFNWENIKHLKDKQTQTLLWLFRKLVVDSILQKLLKKYSMNNLIEIYSVGSTKPTSDYDITLYGNNKYKIIIINEFQKIFKTYFKEDSAIIFDTNIYGKAYISFTPQEFIIDSISYYNDHNCDKKFYYLKENPQPNSQLMWGLIKFYRDIKEGLGEEIFDKIFDYMIQKLNKFNIIELSYNTLTSLLNKDEEIVNYTTLIDKETLFLSSYQDKLLGLHDLISIINFYGTETYFTRGAFLDTVVNSQMCGNKLENIIQIEEIDLITSILENAGFFFIHANKSKYIVRVYNTYLKLISIFSKKYIINNNFQMFFNQLTDIIKQIETFDNNNKEYDSKYCKNLIDDTNSINLLKCEKFKLYNIILNLIISTLDIYCLSNINIINNDIEFYNKFINQKNNIFGEITLINKKNTYFTFKKNSFKNKVVPI